MGIFSGLTQWIGVKLYAKDAEKILPIYRNLSSDECVKEKVSAILALSFLLENGKNSNDDTFSKALEWMQNPTTLTKEDSYRLAQYCMKLASLKEQANSGNNTINKMIASGIVVWILSVRAVIQPKTYMYPLEVWSILQKADKNKYWSEVCRLELHLGTNVLAASLNRVKKFDISKLFMKYK